MSLLATFYARKKEKEKNMLTMLTLLRITMRLSKTLGNNLIRGRLLFMGWALYLQQL